MTDRYYYLLVKKKVVCVVTFTNIWSGEVDKLSQNTCGLGNGVNLGFTHLKKPSHFASPYQSDSEMNTVVMKQQILKLLNKPNVRSHRKRCSCATCNETLKLEMQVQKVKNLTERKKNYEFKVFEAVLLWAICYLRNCKNTHID